ncbi:MAG TPA: COX15/CtaA family protein [Chthoniobacterales bacterium]
MADLRSKWMHRFAFFTAIATLFLIWIGGMVTSKDAGLAVPDWPTTFGYNMFLFPVSKWIGGIFFEHVHRLVAATVGFLTIILSLWLWCVEHRRWLRNLGFAALGAVVLQGVLGGLRVTLLKDEIGIFHACLAQGFFGILIVITLATSRMWEAISANNFSALRKLSVIAITTTALIYLQLALGATMRHEHRDLAILDFPTAYGKFIPEVTADNLRAINAWRDARGLSDVTAFQIWLQMAHRFLALIIAAGIITCLVRARAPGLPVTLARWCDAWFLLVACQITLGAWTIWSNKAADIATTHVAVGAAILGFGITISAICLRLAHGHELASSPRNQIIHSEAAPTL